MRTETITAIASAMTNSGIGIIRVSGDESISVVNKIFRNKNNKNTLMNSLSHTVHYGFIYDGNELIDEVLVVVMKSPNSYTTEDTVEIDCHGGILVMNRILETIIKNGARLAEPGEFTKRAFLNGRIDLSKAEAVIDVINSQNEFSLKSSINQLNGSLTKTIQDVRQDILFEIAFIESALDDPEHISLNGYNNRLQDKVNYILNKIEQLLTTFHNGKMLKEGINTVIVGKPNAGKSSLLNRLVGEEKAIVTNIAGTTRDVLEESIILNGIQLNIFDTAGICFSDDEVEKIGVQKAKKCAVNADLIIYIVDSTSELDEKDEEIIDLIKEKNKIILLNKIDLDSILTETSIKNKFCLSDKDIIIKTSIKQNIGIESLVDKIKDLFFYGDISFNNEVYITNLRHKEAIDDCYESLKLVKKSIKDKMSEDFYSIDLMNAYTSLGYVIGEEVGEDLVNEIFSKFCMGK